MNSVTGGNINNSKIITPSDGETLTEFQKRHPAKFGDYQVQVLSDYVEKMHIPKFTKYCGTDINNFDSRREAVDSDQKLIAPQINAIIHTMGNAIEQLDYYRSPDYVEPKYNLVEDRNEEAKKFVIEVMEEIDDDVQRVKKHIIRWRSSSAPTNASQEIPPQWGRFLV
ncbi:hypothetical protein [Endozoicomonas sp. ONNA2]|uniref:hypothetical protein n=1 Tax=Endozoicomonas sp. ONNA2 TaxID=2828741 RepID=UPI002147D030|nr:hypothetical protein [Endozoicomonas sp. ONNA2]